MRKESAVWGPNRMLYGLIFLAMFKSLGHHIDHVIRATTSVGKGCSQADR
jgi:hypothetical protein